MSPATPWGVARDGENPMTATRQGRQRVWPARLTVGLLSTALALGVIELALRLFWVKHLILGPGIEHPHFHHRLHPNEPYDFISSEFSVSFRTNRYGLRGADPALPKPPGIVRILMLGDSFTFGFPVKDDETFCALIERGLRERGYRADLINGGVSGYSPTLHYISLRDQFLAFDPDVVVLWFDLGDPQEDAWFQGNLLYDASGRILRCDPRYRDGRFDAWHAMKTHSALARYVDTKLLRTLQKIRVLGLTGYLQAKLRGERSKVAMARLKRAQQAADLVDYDRFLLVRETSTESSVRPHWALSARYLAMIHELLAARGIPFLVGIYPYGMLVGPDQWAEGRADWGFERGKTYEARVALSLFEQFAAEQGLELLNTVDSFRRAAASEKLFYDQDGHFTPAGHRVLADHVLHEARFLGVLHRQVAKRSLQVPHE